MCPGWALPRSMSWPVLKCGGLNENSSRQDGVCENLPHGCGSHWSAYGTFRRKILSGGSQSLGKAFSAFSLTTLRLLLHLLLVQTVPHAYFSCTHTISTITYPIPEKCSCFSSISGFSRLCFHLILWLMEQVLYLSSGSSCAGLNSHLHFGTAAEGAVCHRDRTHAHAGAHTLLHTLV